MAGPLTLGLRPIPEWTCVEHDTISVTRIIIAHSRPRRSISKFLEFKKGASKIDVGEFAWYRISWVLAIYRLCDNPPTSIFGARFGGSKSKPSQCHAVPARAGPNSRVRLIFHTEPIYPRLMCSNFDVSIRALPSNGLSGSWSYTCSQNVFNGMAKRGPVLFYSEGMQLLAM